MYTHIQLKFPLESLNDVAPFSVMFTPRFNPESPDAVPVAVMVSPSWAMVSYTPGVVTSVPAFSTPNIPVARFAAAELVAPLTVPEYDADVLPAGGGKAGYYVPGSST